MKTYIYCIFAALCITSHSARTTQVQIQTNSHNKTIDPSLNNSLLLAAVFNKDPESITELFSRDIIPDINGTSLRGETALIKAASVGNATPVQQLINAH